MLNFGGGLDEIGLSDIFEIPEEELKGDGNGNDWVTYLYIDSQGLANPPLKGDVFWIGRSRRKDVLKLVHLYGLPGKLQALKMNLEGTVFHNALIAYSNTFPPADPTVVIYYDSKDKTNKGKSICHKYVETYLKENEDGGFVREFMNTRAATSGISVREETYYMSAEFDKDGNIVANGETYNNGSLARLAEPLGVQIYGVKECFKENKGLQRGENVVLIGKKEFDEKRIDFDKVFKEWKQAGCQIYKPYAPKPVYTNKGKRYETAADAAADTGVSLSSVYQSVSRGIPFKGTLFSYSPISKPTPVKIKPVVIGNGIRYTDIDEASKATGVSVPSIYRGIAKQTPIKGITFTQEK